MSKNSKLIEIPKIVEELNSYQENNQQPIDIYLDCCQQFAKQNFQVENKIISPYTITNKDVQERIFVEYYDSHLIAKKHEEAINNYQPQSPDREPMSQIMGRYTSNHNSKNKGSPIKHDATMNDIDRASGFTDGGSLKKLKQNFNEELDNLEMNDREEKIAIEITPSRNQNQNFNTFATRARDKSLDISKSDISDGQGNLTARLQKRLQFQEESALRMSFSLKQQKAQALGMGWNPNQNIQESLDLAIPIIPVAVTDYQPPFYEIKEQVGISTSFDPKMETEQKPKVMPKKKVKIKKNTTFHKIKIINENDQSLNLSKIEDVQMQNVTMDMSNSHFVIQDESDLHQYYQNLDIKIFKDIIFIEDKQCMIVKTWEKLQHIHTKDICFIKTLRIFDNHNHLIAQILTEQIWSDFHVDHLYDTSTLQFDNKLYFFKRINKKYGSKSSQEQDIYSYLQLFKYDFIARKESAVLHTKDMIINERIYSPEGKDTDITCYNIIFADKFGYAKNKDLNLSEQNFLTQQFVIVQEYIEGIKEKSEWQIYCLCDLKKPISSETDLDGQKTQQIQFFVNVKILDIKGQDEIVLIVINLNTQIHLHFDMNYAQKANPCIFDRQNAVQRITVPKLQIQKQTLKFVDDQCKNQTVDQYFFFDNNNQVTLMHPNFNSKIEKFRYIDLICNKLNIEQVDYHWYKRINYIYYSNCSDEHQEQGLDLSHQKILKINTVQPLEHLRKLLNIDSLNMNQIFTFVNDNKDQILYITEATSNKVIIVQLKDHHCEVCFDEYDPNAMLKKSVAVHKTSSDKNRPEVDPNRHKTQGEMTRKKQRKNHITESANLDLNKLTHNTNGHRDTLSCDINTQEIQIVKNEDGVSPVGDVLQSIAHSTKEGSKLKKTYEKSSCQSEGVHGDKIIEMTNEDGKIFHIPIHSKACCKEFDVFELELYIKNDTHYLIVFSFANYSNGIRFRSYIFAKKTVQKVKKLFEETYDASNKYQGKDYGLIQEEDDVQIFESPKKLKSMKMKKVLGYMQDKKRLQIQLSFECYHDNQQKQNFLAFIYQEQNTSDSNFMLIYELEKNEIVSQIPINPRKGNMKYLHIDDYGFNSYKICRTTDIVTEKDPKRGMFYKERFIQKAKFQVFTIFSQKLGRILCQEFEIIHSYYECKVQMIGQKQIMLSQTVIRDSKWNELIHSQVIHFTDHSNKVLGCQLILKHDKNKLSTINLIDDIYNNLYTYQSQIAYVGQKRFQINRDDSSEFVIVISAKMNEDIIKLNLFDQYETYSILRGLQQMILEMRRPDLEYILLNTFENQKKNDFFKCQEILHGKTFCDICISDPRAIKEALFNYSQHNCNQLENSVLNDLCTGDIQRAEIFKEIQFFPKNHIIMHDFNFDSTVYRGLLLGAHKSINLLINHVFQELNTLDYYEKIMLDLPEVLESKVIDLNSFFQVDLINQENEFNRKAVKEGFCNIEINLEDENLKTFSEHDQQFLIMNNFQSIHEVRQEIIDQIINRDKQQEEQKKKNDDPIEVEHTYIDFKFLIIGEKLKHINKLDEYSEKKYDDEFYANLMLEPSENFKFYQTESAQKIIDCQFKTTQIFMKGLFWFYMILFCIPFCVSLIVDDPIIHVYVFKVCLLPQAALFYIELIQIKENGLDYFKGWNIVDLLQIAAFGIVFKSVVHETADETNGEVDQGENYTSFVQIFLIILSFGKCLHFVTVYEEFGFFVKMLTLCLNDLLPFIFSYIFFGVFFSMLYAGIGVGIDDELASGIGLGYFGLLYLSVWRNSVGKLGFVRYEGIMAKNDNIFRDTQIYMIQILYFIQILFMLVIMLNMMIAIIDSTYRKVMRFKLVHIFKNKAELNQESFQILKYFYELEEYRVLVFSTSKELYEEQTVGTTSKYQEQLAFTMENFKKFIKDENETSFNMLKSAIDYADQVLKQQKELERRVDQDFKKYEFSVDEFKNNMTSEIKNITQSSKSGEMTFRNV